VAAEPGGYHGRHAPPADAEIRPDPPPADPPPPSRNERRRQSRRGQLRGTVAAVVVAAVVAMLIKMFVLQAFLIPSGSMENTLRVGDRVLTDRLSYQLHGVHRGDIVVFSGAGTWNGPVAEPSSTLGRWWHDLAVRAGVDSPDGTVYVKRVIGLPGDRVACCDPHGRVTVNGIPLDEASYVYDDSYWTGSCPAPDNGLSPRCFAPVQVAPGTLWVMGDHRAVSDDSRRHLADPGGGAIDTSRVIGKAVLVLWPRADFRTLGTPGTFSGVPVVATTLLPVLPVLPVVPLGRRRRRRGRPASYPEPTMTTSYAHTRALRR
jgi:signal peptidase I